MHWRLVILGRWGERVLAQWWQWVCDAPMRLIVTARLAFRWFARPPSRRILLVANNELMARWLRMTIDLIRSDSRLRFTVTTDKPCVQTELERIASIVGVDTESYERARMKAWDLLMCADHLVGEPFHPRLPVVHVGHCSTASKRVYGRFYQYNRQANVRPSGRPRYTRCFVASQMARHLAVRECPELDGVVTAVGDPQTDLVLAMTARRQAIRQAFGYGPNETVVLMLSTWGPCCLMAQMGPGLLEQAERLGHRYRFIFSTHPNHWRGPQAELEPWGAYLEAHAPLGCRVIKPDDDTLAALVAADLALTDHGSLAMNFAILDKPMAVVPVAPEGIVERTLAAVFQRILPRLESPDELETLLAELPRRFPHRKVRRIVRLFNSFPGQASERICEAIYTVLQLPPTPVRSGGLSESDVD